MFVHALRRIAESPIDVGRPDDSSWAAHVGRRTTEESSVDAGRRLDPTPQRPPSWNPTIENVPGGGGLYGIERANELARSGEPVLLLGTPTTHILLPDRLGDSAALNTLFQPLIGLGNAPNLLLVSPALRVHSLAELIAMAKRTPLVYASAGTGQTIHVATALFCRQAGIRMSHQPYDDGSASAYADLIAGRVHVYFDNLLGCLDRVRQRQVVPLAVWDTTRSDGLPEVPTLAETGIPAHALDTWMGVFGANRAHAAVELAQSAVLDPRFRDELRKLGLSGGPIDAGALAARVAKSAPGWRRAWEAVDA